MGNTVYPIFKLFLELNTWKIYVRIILVDKKDLLDVFILLKNVRLGVV